MSVLTREVILAEIASGRLNIDPFSPEQLGAASIDLTLGDEIRVFESSDGPIDLREDADYRDHTQLHRLDEPYVLVPGCTIHGITRERVCLPVNICGFLEGRSRFARLGLMIHVTAGFVAPGVDSRQVLEMSNVSTHPLAIHAGVRVCQLVLERCEGSAIYTGRFANQDRL